MGNDHISLMHACKVSNLKMHEINKEKGKKYFIFKRIKIN